MADQSDDRRHNDPEDESIIPADELYDLDISLDDPEEPVVNDLADLEELDELDDLDELDELDDLDLDDLLEDKVDTQSESEPVEGLPEEETPVEETPVEETPVEEVPAEETPVEETPVEETPVEETPAEETPAEEPTAVEESDPEDALAAVFDRRNRDEERDELDLPASSFDDNEVSDFLDEDLEDLDISLQELDEAPRIIRSPDELDELDEHDNFDDLKREPASGYSAYSSATNSAEPEPNMPDSNAATAAETKKGFSLNMADSISMSMGLVALLIAAVAVWLALDSSGSVTALQSEPKKIEKRISNMEQQQAEAITGLTQQVETLQQQLNDLTQVIASKSTQQWQKGLEQSEVKPATSTTPQTDSAVAQPTSGEVIKAEEVVKPEPVKKAVVKAKPKPVVKKLATYEVDLKAIKGWTVNLQSLSREQSAINEVKYLREKDIKAEYGRFSSKGRTWFRVLVQGFEQEHEAIAYKKFLKGFHNIDAWHHKMP